jgi:hypothetical protein
MENYIGGTEVFDLINPSNHQKIGEVVLGMKQIPKSNCCCKRSV